ncbi:nickel-responsive transcriptional regulator NikR [Geminicoccus roseus]|uniref:nickel-responsive transcriptional regulator NikR n=1 Tax=Geminicoccus roseus TaxID=404900 RepID=UPI000403A45B|nr:nickel-responsive transcriptional regulator NikR [Geminicoccus roseus]
MQRATISMSDEFAAELQAFMAARGYDNRSEALRALAQIGLEHAKLQTQPAIECVATLSYVYDHHTRELAKRLTAASHDHHDLGLATMHIHLDAENCLEIAVLRGPVEAVRGFASAVLNERGVHSGHLSVIPIDAEPRLHGHAHD